MGDRESAMATAAPDTGLLAEHLTALRLGRAVDVPRYDFATHSLVGGPAPTGPAPLVVVEGVLVLAVEELRSCLDLGVFVAARAEVREARRLGFEPPAALIEALSGSTP